MNDIEKKVLHELVKDDKNIQMAILAGVTKYFFQYSDTRNLFLIIEHNFKKFQQVLRSDTLQSWLQKSQRMSADDQSKVSVLFEEVKMLPDFSDFHVLLDDFLSYYKTNSIKISLDKTVELLTNRQPDKAMDQLRSDLVTLERAVNSNEIQSEFFAENFQEIIDGYNDAKLNPEKYKGIEMGFSTIDQITNGLPKGSVTIIMGSQKSAKSVLMVNIALYNFLKGKYVYYHSNEGGKILLRNRLICRGTGLVMDKIERHKLDEQEFETYKKFLYENHTSKRLVLDPVPRSLSSASYIYRKVNELQAFHPYDLIIIDYMSLMKPEERDKKQTYEELSNVALDLKDIAAKLQIPIITIMHVNSKGLEEEKDSFDLSEMGLSREPSKHVDLVMSWKVKDIDELNRTRQGQGILSIQASRFCGGGNATLQINTNLMRINEYDLSKVLH